VLELLLFFLGSRGILDTLSGGMYRELSFHLLSRLVLGIGPGMPNSLLLQTQAASHLVVCAFLLFYMINKGSRGRANVAILAVLFLLFLLVITNMSLLIFFLVAAGVWAIRATLKKRIWAILAIGVITAVFYDQILLVFLYRVSTDGAIDPDLLNYYLYFFTIPIVNLADAGGMQFFFGHGMDTVELESGEIGAVTIAFVGGVYVVVLLFAWLGCILLEAFGSYRRFFKSPDPVTQSWISLLFVNLVLCTAWALSTGHYMIILIPGGTHLFAFSLAIVIGINHHLKMLRKTPARSALPVLPRERPAGESPRAG
ncbi:MAG TPA: hypothetical protein VD867_08110, partial [Burkholderiales bacterium]|nr:hypothetical protein [Burkholderiales bacterium]